MANWVLLRGLARESRHWGDFPEKLAKGLAGEVFLADLPGMGQLSPEASPSTIQEICQRVRTETLSKVTAPFHVMALSLGGMVAMEWMKSAPKEISSCVLVNSSSRQSGPFYRRLRWQVWGEFGKILLNQKPRERERAIIELVMNNPDSREEALPLWTKLALESSVSFKNFAAQMKAASSYKGLQERPQVPVLLLSGLGDRLVDPGNSESLRELWEWPIKRHPWAGHDLTWDDSDWVLKQILEWSSQNETQKF